jgi:putative tryptophan/tyrosine transport system substrate-binding protein
MRRREFVRLLGGAAAAPSLFWPLAARAQRLPLLGYLHSASPQPFAEETSAFRQGLSEAGYVDGQNLVIEYRWADGDTDRLPAMAQELVRRHAAVIAAIGGDVTALAAKAATATIPIVFLNGSDPVHSGLVAGINRPGGNVTGVSLFGGTLDGKRLELLRELVPQVALVAVLMNSLVAETGARSRALEEAAHTLGLRLLFLSTANANSMPPSRRSRGSEQVRCSSAGVRSSSTNALSSLLWPRSMAFQPSMRGASSPRRVVS